ncbi:glycine cleavage system aminomethyltransferase GcvT [Atopococcus tabaci]|uniref:glycine cleavage system aminomethyltransferase GcvT n=1 Tax=Atopococcus tabaci TaxID=269774 RepID=UPI002409D962|nr:glycine cleavage system aminomethyltransferase GcvT [Atopococcus tabaci]
MEGNLKQTPLYKHYKDDKIKLMNFGGWALPVQFTSILDEHHAVRNEAGLFDTSHMGEIFVKGEQAVEWLNGLMTNNTTKVKVNQAQYNAVCNENGGTLDDLIIFKLAEDEFLITPNASNTEKIYQWLIEHQENGITVENRSDEYGLLALQGPLSEEIISKVTDADLTALKSYHFIPNITVAGQEGVLLARTGYTGEDGFELYTKWDHIPHLWDALLEAGEGKVTRCGLGARDTLRLEAGLALYGHELSEEITPLEGGIGFAVKTKKAQPFIGQDALRKQREEGLKRVSRGFELVGKGIAREGASVVNESGETIGTVTSGTKSPTLGKSIGLVLIDTHYKEIDTPIWIQVRNRTIEAKLVQKPFYKK